MAAPPIDQYNNLRSKISNVLSSVGLDIELHHHEVAAAGQSEIGFKFGPLTVQGDRSIKYKYVVSDKDNKVTCDDHNTTSLIADSSNISFITWNIAYQMTYVDENKKYNIPAHLKNKFSL